MTTITGIALMIASVYFLGQNIIFTNHYYSSWWQGMPATASVLALLAGICSLTIWRQTIGNFGWILIAVGIILVFVNGGVILRPTSLWTFCVAMLSFISGYQLLTRGRIRL
jgi:hypothetical protein